MFANLSIFLTALLASTASATVVLFSDQDCKSDTTTSGATEANKCWKTDSSSNEWQSAFGCANGHKLRLHQSTDCSDNLDDVDGNDVCQDRCATLNGLAIGSFKCVTDLNCLE